MATLDFWEAAREEGREEGRREGREEAREEARREGFIETQANSVLIVLRVRGIVVSDAEREQILAEKDLDRLQRWLERASVAASIAAVLDESI